MPSNWGDSSKSLRNRPFLVFQLGTIRAPAGRPVTDLVDDTGGAGLGTVPFWRVPFPSVRCWREDTFAWCPWIHVRATLRLPNGPRRFAQDPSRYCGVGHVETHVWFSVMDTLLALFPHAEPGCIVRRPGSKVGCEHL